MNLNENQKRFDRIGRQVNKLIRSGKPVPPKLDADLQKIGRKLFASELSRGEGIIAATNAARVMPPHRQSGEFERVRGERRGITTGKTIKDVNDAIRAFQNHSDAAEIISKPTSIENYKKDLLNILTRQFAGLNPNRVVNPLSPTRARSLKSSTKKIIRILSASIPRKSEPGDDGIQMS